MECINQEFQIDSAPAGESQPSVEVDLFASTSKIKILNAKTQEVIMEHPLRSISYIGNGSENSQISLFFCAQDALISLLIEPFKSRYR